MKKLFLAIIITLFFVMCAYAQEVTPVPKQPTIEELQWRAAYLNERIKVLQMEFKNVQDALAQVQAQMKALTPAPPPPKPEDKPKDAADPKKGKK